VDYAALSLRVQAVGLRKGAWTQIDLAAPTIKILPGNLIVDPSALTAAVLKKFQEYSDRLNDIEDFVGNVVGKQEIANWEDKIKIKKTEWRARDKLQVNINTVETRVDSELESANSSIVETRTAITALDGAFIARNFVIDARFNGNEALISENETAIVDLTGSFIARNFLIDARFNGNEALISENETAIVDLTGSFIARNFLIDARFNGNEALISENETAIVDQTGSIIARNIVINTRFADNEASITQTQTSLATLDLTFSNFTTTISATVNGHTASIATVQTAVATVNGRLAAFYGLTVNGDGHVASMQLGSDGTTAAVKFLADVFQIALTGYTDLPPFSVGLIDGAPALGFRGGTFLDGELYVTKSAHMAALTVETLHILDAAVTVPDSASAGSSGFTPTYTTCCGKTISVTAPSGTTVYVAIAGNIDYVNQGAGASTSSNFEWQLLVDGSQVAHRLSTSLAIGPSFTDGVSGFYSFTATGLAQSVVIELQYRAGNGIGNSQVLASNFFVVAYKK
jgi:hypothetical protein